MPLRRLLRSAASLAIIFFAVTATSYASTFSSVVVYGDSLSDNGNLYALTGVPGSPYYQGRYSNGPVAVEQLAAALGVPLYDYAFAGATTGVGNYGDGGTQTSLGLFGLPGMLAEFQASAPLLASPLVPSSLFVVWGGANDFLIGGSITTGVADIDAIVASLLAKGATHILVPGIPDLGLTPDFFGNLTATLYSQQFNAALQASLPKGATYVDTFNLTHQITGNPSAYGFTDVKDPCYNGTTVCANPNQYLFYDGFHPTTAADAILAKQFAAVAQTPEPSTFLLLGTGVGALTALVRRKRAA